MFWLCEIAGVSIYSMAYCMSCSGALRIVWLIGISTSLGISYCLAPAFRSWPVGATCYLKCTVRLGAMGSVLRIGGHAIGAGSRWAFRKIDFPILEHIRLNYHQSDGFTLGKTRYIQISYSETGPGRVGVGY